MPRTNESSLSTMLSAEICLVRRLEVRGPARGLEVRGRARHLAVGGLARVIEVRGLVATGVGVRGLARGLGRTMPRTNESSLSTMFSAEICVFIPISLFLDLNLLIFRSYLLFLDLDLF